MQVIHRGAGAKVALDFFVLGILRVFRLGSLPSYSPPGPGMALSSDGVDLGIAVAGSRCGVPLNI
jgi:hypothetical protein